MMEKRVGSLSMKIAPVSSLQTLRLGILPERSEQKKESGTQERVSLEVENRWPPTFKLMISPVPGEAITALHCLTSFSGSSSPSSGSLLSESRIEQNLFAQTFFRNLLSTNFPNFQYVTWHRYTNSGHRKMTF